MKRPNAVDRPRNLQIAALCVLTILPITMIAVNGGTALRRIFAEVPPVVHDAVHAPIPTSAGPARIPFDPVRFGIYDPSRTFVADRNLSIRHHYISWVGLDAGELGARLAALERDGFEVMLTIEPWPKADIQQPLLQAITAGQYDDNLASLAQSLQALQGPVYLSWGHEMDQDLTRRYPWSAASPADFIAAYRYVVDWLRQRVQTEIRWIWTAVLKEGSARYWPGDAYADFVGMPVYSFPEFDHATYGYIRHFRQTYEDKRKIATQFGKPLCITELGVHGSAEFASFWLHQAFLALDDYPELAMVIFFYSRDSAGAWGDRFSVPDWRVHGDTIRGLVDWKKAEKR